MRRITPIDIELGVPFITQRCASGILRTIVEILMYQRNQIPFLYATFRSMMRKLELSETTPSDEDVTARMRNMYLTKQRNQAMQAFQNTEILFETIEHILMNHAIVREVMILFGRTIYTAKEAIVINLPPIDENHYGHNHQHKTNKYLSHIVKILSQSDENLNNMQVHDTTNMFVLVKPFPQTLGSKIVNGIHPLDEFQLPLKCVRFDINLKTTDIAAELALCCCKKLQIFEDDPEVSSIIQNGAKCPIESEVDANWHQVDLVVKGFKPVVGKGYHLWD